MGLKQTSVAGGWDYYDCIRSSCCICTSSAWYRLWPIYIPQGPDQDKVQPISHDHCGRNSTIQTVRNAKTSTFWAVSPSFCLLITLIITLIFTSRTEKPFIATLWSYFFCLLKERFKNFFVIIFTCWEWSKVQTQSYIGQTILQETDYSSKIYTYKSSQKRRKKFNFVLYLFYREFFLSFINLKCFVSVRSKWNFSFFSNISSGTQMYSATGTNPVL